LPLNNSFWIRAIFQSAISLCVQQKSITCKSCRRKFLAPPVDTGRQEISDIDDAAAFALICPFCMAHALYTPRDLE